jgi:hypothetical protein
MVVKYPNDILLDLDRMIEELTRLRARVAAWTAERERKGESLIHLDDEGCLVFSSEEAYAAYLDSQPDKYPSEIRAYFIDEHNFKVRYSDYEPTPEKIRELKEARQEIAEGDVVDGEEAFRKLGL